MLRRDFMRLAGVASISMGMMPSCVGTEESKVVKNWAWLRGISNREGAEKVEDIKRLFDTLKRNGIDGIVPSGSNERYRELAPLCREFDITLHGWRWTMNRGAYIKEKPHLYAVSREGRSVIDSPPYVGYYRWMCPSKPETMQLIVDDYKEMARIDGLEAVHLDYVRYCDVILPIALQPKYNLVQDYEMPQFDYCYCEDCRRGFKEEHGVDPLDMEDPSKSPEWHRYRLDLVVKIVNEIAKEIHAMNKQVSAAVFPTPTIARELVRQDWEKFDIDTFMPMGYMNDYNGDLNWLKDVVEEDARVIKSNGKDQKLYMGLNMSHVRDFGVEQSVSTCLDSGADGVSFFMGTSFTPEEFTELKRTVDNFKG